MCSSDAFNSEAGDWDVRKAEALLEKEMLMCACCGDELHSKKAIVIAHHATKGCLKAREVYAKECGARAAKKKRAAAFLFRLEREVPLADSPRGSRATAGRRCQDGRRRPLVRPVGALPPLA